MKQEPVVISLLKTIIKHYPVVPSYLIHSAGREKCLSGATRLRELRQTYFHSIMYQCKDHHYFFPRGSKGAIRWVLQEEKRLRRLK